jgi:hypothetical protein
MGVMEGKEEVTFFEKKRPAWGNQKNFYNWGLWHRQSQSPQL